MRLARATTSVVLYFILVLSASAQETQTFASPQRDPQAIAILTQAIAVGHRAPTGGAIQDYVATGTITYFWAGKEVSGPVTIKGRGPYQYHLEAQLPQGRRSIIVNRDQGSLEEPDGRVSKIPDHNAITAAVPVSPEMFLTGFLADITSDIGSAEKSQIKGHQAHNIALRPKTLPFSPGHSFSSKLLAKNVFVDADTNLVVKISDKTHTTDNGAREFTREYEFEDYSALGGATVSTLIREKIAGQTISEIHLTAIEFNKGLSDADFLTK